MLRSSRLISRIDAFISTKTKPNFEVLTLDTLPSRKLLTFKPDEVNEERWIDGCRWIIHLLMILPLKSSVHGNFVSLNSKKLKEVIGNDYKVYLNALKVEKIITCDGQYSSKYGSSFGYQLSHTLLDGKVIYRTITDARIKKALRKRFRENNKLLKVRNRRIPHITRWLTDDYVILEREHALQFVDTLKRKTERKLKEVVPKNKKEEREISNYSHHRYQLMYLGLQRWQHKKLFSIDNAGGRLYNSLTRMPSIMRNFLCYKDGKTLVSADIKNSQPFHFLFMLRKEFWKRVKSSNNLFTLLPSLFNHIQPQIKRNTNLIMFPKYSESVDIQGVDVVEFINLLTTGKLYEFISDNFKGKFIASNGFDPFSTRELAKRKFLHMMYFDPQKHDPEIKRIFHEFKSIFPNIATIIDVLKSMSHRHFPIILQKIEVKMLLVEVGKEIYKHDANIPVFSIHDSLVTTIDHIDTVESILKGTYKRLLNHEPKLDRQEWSINAAYSNADDYIQKKLNEKKWSASNVVKKKIPVEFTLQYNNMHTNFLNSLFKLPYSDRIHKVFYINPFGRKLKTPIVEINEANYQRITLRRG